MVSSCGERVHVPASNPRQPLFSEPICSSVCSDIVYTFSIDDLLLIKKRLLAVAVSDLKGCLRVRLREQKQLVYLLMVLHGGHAHLVLHVGHAHLVYQ